MEKLVRARKFRDGYIYEALVINEDAPNTWTQIFDFGAPDFISEYFRENVKDGEDYEVSMRKIIGRKGVVSFDENSNAVSIAPQWLGRTAKSLKNGFLGTQNNSVDKFLLTAILTATTDWFEIPGGVRMAANLIAKDYRQVYHRKLSSEGYWNLYFSLQERMEMLKKAEEEKRVEPSSNQDDVIDMF